ncbi:hypothetical protein LTR70_007900 [Exophiala xenobiotica]|uniref:Cupin type-2 domain-containing protein n=1 Tax=Lithohypha guttulata TaxID=1690604 RepID=A0ABR0KA57_9EURO|nr:hypothetical protein LTR24_005576 [Lithohypha guttulata]KAK5312905.1 hypothetical protein LTR70_007900 [Exophiala xenobiotica]
MATLDIHPKKTDNQVAPIVLHHAHITSIPPESFPDKSKGTVSWQTLLSSPSTPTNSLTAGIASCPPRSGYLALHRHKQAEIYHVISGRGVVKIEGVDHEVAGGDVVFIPGDAEHGIWNVSGEEELRWLYCFAVDGFGEVVYRFSGEEKM